MSLHVISAAIRAFHHGHFIKVIEVISTSAVFVPILAFNGVCGVVRWRDGWEGGERPRQHGAGVLCELCNCGTAVSGDVRGILAG